jgi:hypothetical protein
MRKENIEAEIERINKTIAGILAGGQSYEISSGGGRRSTVNASLETLYKRRDALEYSLACINGETGLKAGIGW